MSGETPCFKISYYDEFRCLQGECPDSCCHGWSIPIDDEALKLYGARKGLFGLKLKLSIHGRERKVFSPMALRCPHLRADGLCELQKKRGEVFLPQVCRDYPRVVANYGPRAEYQLDLSCVHAASLFLRDPRGGFVPAEEEKLPELYGNNEDAAYFEKLLRSRGIIFSQVHSAGGDASLLDAALRDIAAKSRAFQDALIGGNEEADFGSGEEEGGAMRLFPLPIAELNEMMSTCFYEDWLRYSAPFLFRLCRLYYRRFDKLGYEAGEKELMRLFGKHVAGKAEVTELFGDYFLSLVARRYLFSYEDYSPFRHVKEALLVTDLVLLFYLLWCEKYGPPISRTLAHVISVTEKRAFHNDFALKDLLASVKST
ncbi:MAG: flagellin lysine-N-methylase [Lachnospiraceae bacterium]|nr:flagellin lysine-N-methylase [Lachnospiraceae bacterium]